MEGLLQKVDKALEGKKTYIVALLIGVAAAVNALGYVVPEWVYVILGAAGLGAVRSGITKKGV